jgi:putative glutamine amidotransferase
VRYENGIGKYLLDGQGEVMPSVIGLTTYGYQEKRTLSQHYEYHYALPKEYVDAVIRAGGIPLLIPPTGGNWRMLWRLFDGIIIAGGTDVAPQYYQGDTSNPKINAEAPERDATEIALVQYAFEMKDKPVLCICRGMQVLNVALGGTLHAHIPDIREQVIHRSAEGVWALHDCTVKADSQLAQIMGTESVHTYSGHHQAVNQVANGLHVVATAPDGIIEAVVAPDHPWLVGVQWHPEKSAATDPTQQRLFDAFVAA